ncbi:MAG TPA: alginate lyase family protein [Anaerolineales bacterium]|nr:alginate lyase family protein [Anaerolineales bacterium]
MAPRKRILLTFQALRELGLKQLALYAWYQAQLRSGYLHRATPDNRNKPASGQVDFTPRSDLLSVPDPDVLRNLLSGQSADVFFQAEEVLSGQVRLFGGQPVPLSLTPPGSLQHWTYYEHGNGQVEGIDIKLIWEPARFGWVYPLARAYHLNQDERYAEAFWRDTETFLRANPVNEGPNWASGQEVALRLVALAFSWQVFHKSSHSTQERALYLGQAIAEHAARLPPTLAYARAQNNNHLLVEAAGLFTAGLILPDHPSARRWQDLGWKWFNRALQGQIAVDGTYLQHSTNYHRLMLQIALWGNCLGRQFPEKTQQRLAASTRWLLALLDPASGRVPNLGHNDGAYILPLTVCPYEDYRPVLQAAALAFLGMPVLPPGAWDEMSAWFGVEPARNEIGPGPNVPPTTPATLAILESPARDCWVYLRTARFTSRPAHADQLHLDLWWRGLNLALDAGTYLYNAPSPWENTLRVTQVHNTLTVEDQDQMTPAGRFLWLNWAQAELLEAKKSPDGRLMRVSAQHDGYNNLGLIHRRAIAFDGEARLVVEDDLLPVGVRRVDRIHTFRLHWLLPDWPWEGLAEGVGRQLSFRFKSPLGWIDLRVYTPTSDSDEMNGPVFSAQLARAGALLSGSGPVEAYSGWYSATYAHKQPALSLSFRWTSRAPVKVISEWSFPS